MEINNIPTPITPSRYSYSPTGSFKFWCQKVLPTVYDDSLSYYEILCKVVNYLNEVIKNVDGLNEDITTMYSSFDELQSRLITAYAELEGYVNTYFDNLDVQNEINEKLDAMARTGALTSLISPFIPSLVTSWLDQHVVPTSPAIDKTLSIADAGADAKVVGDRIREDEIDIVRAITYSGLGYSPFNTRYINGNIDNEGHVTTTNDITNHVITSRATTTSRIVTLNADSGYQFRVFGYDSSDNYTGEMTDGWTTSYTFPANSSFRLLIAMSPDSANNKLYPTMAMSRVRYQSGIGYEVDNLKISAELTNDINENYKYETYRLGQGYVSFYTNYVNGNIDSNGAVTVGTPLTRVVTSLMHIETRDVPVTSYNNIVFRVFEYTSADSFVREKTSGWTNRYTVPKNLYFRLLISRNPEGTATLTPNTAKSHVIYPDTIATRISTLESDETRFKNCMVSRFPRKKVSIIGDSIETWDEEGYKIDGYRMYYPNNDMDLHDVSDTWWYKVIVASGSLLEVNASYSGSRVTKTAPNPDYPDLWERISVIGNPNLVYIALGTNDSAGNVALGEYDFTSSIDSLSRTQFRPALIKGIKGIYQAFPQTTIVYIIERMADEYKESIKYICLQLDVKYIDVSSYYGGGVHPPVRGMREIASMVLTKTDDELLQSGFPADAKIVGEQINKTNANVIDIDNNYKYETYRLGQGYSSIYASYTNGDINSNGVVTEGTPVTRVVSSLVSYSGRDIPLSASDGYQIRVFSYDSQGTFQSELTSGNWYQSFTIPNGTYFKLLIRRNPEGTTRLAPDTAKSHVTYLSTFAVSIQENKANITDIDNNYKYETYKLGQGYASVYATYTNGDIDANGSATVGSPITRVISSITRYTGRDLELNCENGYQFKVFSYTEQSTFISELTSGWSQSCVVPNGTYFRMLISRNPEGTAKLAPNTAKSHVVFLTTLASNVQNNTNDITELKADLNESVGDLKSAIGILGDGVNYTPIVLHENCSIDTYGSEKVILPSNIKSETGWVCACVPCEPGDVFTVSGYGGYTTRFWTFADSNGTLIEGSESGAYGKDVKTIPAPEGSAYFAFNSNMNNANWPYNAYKGEVPTKVFETLQTDIDDTNSNLQTTELFDSVSFESSDDGHFIGANGTYDSSAPFSITAPFLLKKGYTLKAFVCGYAGAVAVIASYSNNAYTPLVIDDGSTDSKEYLYTADVDTNIVISYSRNKAFKASIVLKVYDFVNTSQKNAFGYGCLFPRIAVCGDSLSSGVLVQSSGNEVHVYGDSWLSYIARRINATARNHYSEGGMTCKSWLTNYLTKMQTDEASNAYFVALGTNDAYFYDIGLAGSYPIGNISDEVGTDTFVGYYKQIITALRTKAPNAVIFCVSNYNSNALAHQYSEMISAIADLYDNCFYVDFINNTDVYTSTGGVWSNIAHFTTIGYAYVSNVIYDLVNRIVEENKEFFKWFGKNNSSGGQYED